VDYNLKNFILLYYKKDFLSDHEIDKNTRNPENPIQLDTHLKMFKLCYKRIKHLYPKSTIHVISNVNKFIDDSEWYHRENISLDYTNKFQIYGLINEPAIYIDNDIMLLKKFTDLQLDVDVEINPYQVGWKNYFFKNKVKYFHFSACALLLKNPSKELQNKIIQIHQDFFVKETDNDEFALSKYLEDTNQKSKVKMFEEIGYPRSWIKNKKDLFFSNIQSIHYSFPKYLYEIEIEKLYKCERIFL
jgi:hypothetical protein